MCLSHSLYEVDHGDGIGRYSMIRPGKVMILGHFKGWCVWFLTLKRNVKENKEQIKDFYSITDVQSPHIYKKNECKYWHREDSLG